MSKTENLSNIHEGYEAVFTNENNFIPEEIMLEFEEKLKPYFAELKPAKIFDLKTRTEIIHEMRNCLKTVIYEKEFFELANKYLLPIINNISSSKKHVFEFIESHVDLIKYQQNHHFDIHFDYVSNHTNFSQQYTLLIGLNNVDEGRTFIWNDELDDFKPYNESISRGGMVWFCSDIKHFAEKLQKNSTKIVLSFQLKATKYDNDEDFDYENIINLKSIENNDYFISKNLIKNTLFEVMLNNNDISLNLLNENKILSLQTNLDNNKLSKIVSYLKKSYDFDINELEEIREILNFYMINHADFIDCKIPSKYLHYLNENFADKDYIVFNKFESWMNQWAKDMNYIPFQIVLYISDEKDFKNANIERFSKYLNTFTNNDFNFWKNINKYINKTDNINCTNVKPINIKNEVSKNEIINNYPFSNLKNISAITNILFNDLDRNNNNYQYDYYDYDYYDNYVYMNHNNENQQFDENNENQQNNENVNQHFDENENINQQFDENENVNQQFDENDYVNQNVDENNEITISFNKKPREHNKRLNFNFDKNMINTNKIVNYFKKIKYDNYTKNMIQKHLNIYEVDYDSLTELEQIEYNLMNEAFGNDFNYTHMKKLNFSIELLYIFYLNNQNIISNNYKFRTIRKNYYENIQNLNEFNFKLEEDKFFEFNKIYENIKYEPLKIKYGDIIKSLHSHNIEILTTINNGELLFGTNNMGVICQIINSFKNKDESYIPLVEKLKNIIHLFQYAQFNDLYSVNKNINYTNFFDDNFLKFEQMYFFNDYEIVNNLLEIRLNNYIIFMQFIYPFFIDKDMYYLNNASSSYNNEFVSFKRTQNINFDDNKFYFDTNYVSNEELKNRIKNVFKTLDFKDALSFRDNIKHHYSYEESGCNDDGGDIYHESNNYMFNVFYVYYGFLKPTKN